MLEPLKTVISERFPELKAATFKLLTQGWDSLAVEVDERLIFKFPRDAQAAEALRREARMLQVIRQHVTLPIPELTCFETSAFFTKHAKLPGDHLLTVHYEGLSNQAKQRLSQEVALFYAQLHAIDPPLMHAAGALPTPPWPEAETVLGVIQAFLPKGLLKQAESLLDQWQQLREDPYGATYGYFDGHGWNMAFDHTNQKLNGIYDFADASFGQLHEEFIYSSFISFQLTSSLMTRYQKLTGRFLDQERVLILSGVIRLVELAQSGSDVHHGETVRQNAIEWLSQPQYP
jgi:aminoglycoside phosphotransferase (APT) family kinase protein